MTSRLEIHSNPALTVGEDNKQHWNQPANRRHGFHNVHRLFRRAFVVQSRHVLSLASPTGTAFSIAAELKSLLENSAFSALSMICGQCILFEHHAPDFGVQQPHSIQSVTKMHIHLIVGRLIAQGLLDLNKPVSDYLPNIGSGYASSPVQDLLNMNVENDFSEDYSDPHSDCYTEEIALGWRLPDEGIPETGLSTFVHGITGDNLQNLTDFAQYKSANTDVLTVLCASVIEGSLLEEVEAIADAVGYEDGFHISLSPDGLPAFSGGGCLSVRDLARFGQLIARGGNDIHGQPFANSEFLEQSVKRRGPKLEPPRGWLSYSNHLMTDGRFVCHAGYGGQFLMVDTVSGISCAYLSVLENESGYDLDYMENVSLALKAGCKVAASQAGSKC